MTSLLVHICDQRRSVIVEFATAAQAVTYCHRRSEQDERLGYAYGNHAYLECEEDPICRFGPLSQGEIALIDFLYPKCEHQLSADLCCGPQHYPMDM
jgi:hypothetical protein